MHDNKVSTTPTSIISGIISRATKSVVFPNLDYVDNYVVIPPDGGYGWFIVFMTFICYFLVDGIIYTFGLFLYEVSVTLNVKPTEVALASSLMSGFYYLVGPLTCAIANRYGFRVVGILGGIISGSALLLSTFFLSLKVFLVLIGVFCGIGFNMIYIPCLLIVGFYFEKWRALATAISMCGSSLGVIAFPPLVSTLMKDLHWTWKFRVLSGLTFLTCGCTFSFRPIAPTVVQSERKFPNVTPGVSTYSFNTDKDKDPKQKKSSTLKIYHNTTYPTTSDLQDTTSVYTITRKQAYDGVSESSTPRSMFMYKTDNMSMSLSTLYEADEDALTAHCLKRCCRKVFCCYWKKRKSPVYIEDVHRPMYRDDIFYTGSLYALKEYSIGSQIQGSLQKSNVSYHKSVTRVPTQRDVEQNQQCVLCPEAFLRTLITMLHLKLLTSMTFLVLTLSGFFSAMALYCPFIFIVERAIDMKVDEGWANMLLTVVGVANTIGRIMCGAVSWFPDMNLYAINYVTIILAGISIVASSYLASLSGQIAFATVFGFCISSLSVLRSILVVDLMGLENLTNAFGITCMFYGFGCFIGVPLAGLLYNYTGKYDATFIFAGSSMIVSGLLIIPLKRLSKWENNKGKKMVSFKE